MKRATKPSEVMQALAPRPLSRPELQEFFKETANARDPHLVRRYEIASYLENEDNVKVLVTGHAGTGKSTELQKFQEENSGNYAFVTFSLIEEAQLSQAGIEVLLVLIVESLVRHSKNYGAKLSDKTLESIYRWFSDVFEIEEKDLQFDAEVSASADTNRTFLGKMLGMGGALKADIKTGSHTLNRCITKENKRLSQLAYHCNVLVKEAKTAVWEGLRKELLLIVEDLDKVSIQAADDIFIQNPAPLSGLSCKAVFTAPISLLCNPRSVALDSEFKKVCIPMIKTVEQDGSVCKEGRAALKDILDKRMDLSTLIDGDALDLAVEKTAGVLRHLFEALTTAAMAASQAVKNKSRKEEKIVKADVRYGLDRLKAELVRRIGVVGLPKEYEEHKITVEGMFKRLKDLGDKAQTVESDPLNLLLLQGHALIEYNAKGWHRVHPLILEHLQSAT